MSLLKVFPQFVSHLFGKKKNQESVSHIETIVSVDKHRFKVFSDNHDPKDYFVSWIAILDEQPV